MKISHSSALLTIIILSIAGIALTLDYHFIGAIYAFGALLVALVPIKRRKDAFMARDVSVAVSKIEGGKVNQNIAEINDVLSAFREVAGEWDLDELADYVQIGSTSNSKTN